MKIDNVKYNIYTGKEYNMLVVEVGGLGIIAWAQIPMIPMVSVISGNLSKEDIRALTDRRHASFNLPDSNNHQPIKQ